MLKVIETKDLTKFYGKSRGIKNLNLCVNEGDFFGFIGPNGAGKSTTIRILLGLISKSGGKAKVFDKDISENKAEILKNIGYLPSEAMFYSGMKVKNIIKLSAKLRKQNCDKEAEVLCQRLCLDTSKKVEELSFGNRKKVAIVCALQHNPKLLILDEPTSGLDPLMQHEFFEILKERNQNGTTVFLSSHILSEIQHNCSKAAIIREGEIIACDSVENLSNTCAKRVTVRGDIDLIGLSGVRDFKINDGTQSFLFGGDINLLLSEVSKVKINDISISEPDLEEIFLHYYRDGGENK